MTGISPFFANKGYHPNLAIHPECDLISSRAQDFVVDLDELHQELRRAILNAQQAYQISANTKQIPAPDFKVGNLAFVKAQFFRTTRPTKKLAEKFLGPFEIIAHPGTHSVTLKLPDYMKVVHPIFHISMLEPTSPNTIPNCTQPPRLLSPSMVNQNLKSPRFWTPKLIIDTRHASCFIWYGGQVMKARMKKPHGSSRPRLTTRPSLFKTFTSLTQLSPDHYPLSECLIIYALKSLLKKKRKRIKHIYFRNHP